MNEYFRANIDAMAGYIPGEQPQPHSQIIKLNSNENPYPPSPLVLEVLRNFDAGIVATLSKSFCTGSFDTP